MNSKSNKCHPHVWDEGGPRSSAVVLESEVAEGPGLQWLGSNLSSQSLSLGIPVG